MCQAPPTTTRTTLVTARWDRHDEDGWTDQADDDHNAGDKEDEDKDEGEKL